MSQPPPGLDDDLVELTSGGQDFNWRELPVEKLYTNVFVWNKSEQSVLLGMKKRGFGVEMYNGFGGKVEPGETPIQAALRELKEEACISAQLQPCGILLFVSEGLEYAHKIHVFKAHEYEGAPAETDEMAPEWFSIPTDLAPARPDTPSASASALTPIPFDKMWADDRIWMPYLFNGTYFYGRVDFGKGATGSGESVFERWWFGRKP